MSPFLAESGMGRISVKPRGAANASNAAVISSNLPLRPADQIHLVHREGDALDPEQRDQQRVPPRLAGETLPSIHQDHGDIGRGGTGRHVAGVLLVAGRVGDDERALVGGEETIGDIDGDALLALGLETVHEEGEVDLGALGAVLARIALQRRHLIVEDLLGVVQEAADQGRLAVIDGAAGDEAQHFLALVSGEEAVVAEGFG